MKNQNLLDQFILADKEVVEKMVSAAEIGHGDSVMEIGAGNGVITKEIAKKSGRVIAVEIDKKFSQELKQIHGNIRLIFDSAIRVVKDRKKYPIKFNKIIGSLPSSIVEPLAHVLIKTDFELAVFLVPLKFAFKLTADSVFTAYFNVEILKKVSRKSFFPIPKTNWAIVKMSRKPDPLKVGDQERFLRQFIYEHPKAKIKNALVEGLIKFYKIQGITLTKNQARKLSFKLSRTKTPP